MVPHLQAGRPGRALRHGQRRVGEAVAGVVHHHLPHAAGNPHLVAGCCLRWARPYSFFNACLLEESVCWRRGVQLGRGGALEGGGKGGCLPLCWLLVVGTVTVEGRRLPHHVVCCDCHPRHPHCSLHGMGPVMRVVLSIVGIEAHPRK